MLSTKIEYVCKKSLPDKKEAARAASLNWIAGKTLEGFADFPLGDQRVQRTIVFHRLDRHVELFAQLAIALADAHADAATD